MEPFIHLAAIAAPLPRINVDTDAIIAVQDLYTLTKTGLGKSLFRRWRFGAKGEKIDDFVLNMPQYESSRILVARANFGCGSSREHAVWALHDYGFRCIIAPSFASIFYENCIKNGILPLTLPEADVERLLELLQTQKSKQVAVDLEACTVLFPDETIHAFEIDASLRDALLKGLDPISVALLHSDEIREFQRRQRERSPWIWPSLNRGIG